MGSTPSLSLSRKDYGQVIHTYDIEQYNLVLTIKRRCSHVGGR